MGSLSGEIQYREFYVAVNRDGMYACHEKFYGWDSIGKTPNLDAAEQFFAISGAFRFLGGHYVEYKLLKISEEKIVNSSEIEWPTPVWDD